MGSALGGDAGDAVHDRAFRRGDVCLGIALGLALFLTARGGLFHNRTVYSVMSIVVNVFRSIPFIILIVLLIPFTKTVVGTILGANAALPALIVGAAPFYARLVEIALREVDKGSLRPRVRWARG